jgi:hypothetical protein
MNAATLQVKDNAIASKLYMAMELSHKSWKRVFGDGVKRRGVTIEAGHREQLREAMGKAKEKFHLPIRTRPLQVPMRPYWQSRGTGPLEVFEGNKGLMESITGPFL